MLKAIKKLMNQPQEGKPSMKKEEIAAAVVAAPMASAVVDAAQLASLQESLSAALSQLAEQGALLAAADEAKAQLISQAAIAKFSARKTAIVAAVGDASASALLAATETLDDASFNLVVGSMVTARAVEAASPAFNEVGHSAEAEVPVHGNEESGVAKLLKKQYGIA